MDLVWFAVTAALGKLATTAPTPDGHRAVSRGAMVILSAHQIRWSGLAALIGGILAVILTLPFAAAYFRAYPGFDVPPLWLPAVRSTFDPLLTFASAVAVYNTYGRIFNLVYLLILPGVVSLHSLQQEVSGRFERWAVGVLVIGLVMSFIGVAGDYWADGLGWPIELLGLLVLLVGTTLFGIASLQAKRIPIWSAWLLIIAGPGAIVATWLIGHIPSGPTFLFACSWVVLGYILWRPERNKVQ
jgi:hypothetical protein